MAVGVGAGEGTDDAEVIHMSGKRWLLLAALLLVAVLQQ